jgi:cell division septation protein DedD
MDPEGMKKGVSRRRPKFWAQEAKFFSKAIKDHPWAWIAVGSFFVVFVAFVSGVRMGKALTDLQYEEEVVMKPSVKERKSFPSTPESKVPDLTQSPKTEGAEAEVEEKQAPAKGLPEKTSSRKDEATRAISEKPSMTPPSNAKFSLQVAALNNPEEARELVNQLRKKGYSAYQITGSGAAKGAWHRVRVGYFPSLAEAKQFALIFEKKEKIKTIIVSLPAP